MTDSSRLVLRAQWIAPISGPIIENGAIVVDDDTIVFVGPADASNWRSTDTVHDCGRVILLPGLINAHTHLELSNVVAGDNPGGTFTDWIVGIRAKMKAPTDGTHFAAAGAVEGVRQCLKVGVTTVGDITQNPAVTRPVLCDGPLRVVSFGEVLGLGKMFDIAAERFTAAVDQTNDSHTLRSGVSPHAPYTVDLRTFRDVLAYATKHHLPLATHLAEDPFERDFLLRQSGPFRDVWDRLDMWTPDVKTHRAGPIRFAHDIGLLDYPRALLAHVNYCDDEELRLLAAGRASVVWCPRTHAYFDRPPHRWREMLSRGVNVAVGTDSAASSPDLNIVDDLRLLWNQSDKSDAALLWSLVTTRAAKALGMADNIGSLEIGKLADIIAFPVNTTNPLASILDGRSLPASVWMNGKLLPV